MIPIYELFLKNNIPKKILDIVSKIEYNNFNDENKYIIRSVEEVLKSKKGIYYELVEVQRELFEKNNYEIKTYFSYEKLPITDNPTHTYLIFKENNKYYYFESSWYKNRGIHGEFKNYNKTVKYVEKCLKDISKWKSVNTIEYKRFNYNNMNINQFGEYILKNFT